MNRRPTRTNSLIQAMWALILLAMLVWTFPYPPSTAQQGMGPGPGVKSYSGGGGAADFVTDTFTAASDQLLASHTGELGATWTVHPSYAASTTLDAATDRIFPTGDPQAYYASGVPANADYTVCADVFTHTDVSENIGPCGRMSTSANTMYCLRYNTTVWQLRKLIAGAATTLGSSVNQLISTGTSKRACVVMSGSSISGTVEGVTEIGPVTDNDITAAGRAGWRSSGVATATTGYHLDNFSASQ